MNGYRSCAYLIVALIAIFTPYSSDTYAHGTINGGHCYNGWHLYDGRCHKPHGGQSEKREVQRFIRNGGHCYNDWYLDRKTGKCKESLGWFESEDDTIILK